MKRFDYKVAVNQLQLGKDKQLNTAINYDLIPSWVQGADFLKLFLPYLKIVGDSREQDKWVEEACKYMELLLSGRRKTPKQRRRT